MNMIDNHFEAFTYIYAIIGICGIEFLSRQNYYGYGIDDAFVLGFLGTVCLAVGVNTESPTAAFATLAVAGFFCCVRYVHTISALVCLVGITGFFCCLVFDLKIIASLYLPFIGFLLAVVLFAIHEYLSKKDAFYFYKYALQVLLVFSLVLGYASVNYFVVRELSVALIGVVVDANHDIPFAPVFYFLTFAIPMAYLFFALRRKNREMLVVGLFALACSVLTIRYYYSLLPAETALILGGLVLFGLSWLLISKLRHKESGITFERDRHSDKNALLYAQAALINSQISVKPQAIETGDMPFGGGGFSGGGSEGSY